MPAPDTTTRDEHDQEHEKDTPTPRRLNVLVDDDDAIVRDVDPACTKEIDRQLAQGTFRPQLVPAAVSGISRDMTVLVGTRTPATIIKYAWHGDAQTFCPPIWADIAIGSGACGFLCRTCFLMLTFRAMRDPARPVVYTNGDDFERRARQWLRAQTWPMTRQVRDAATGKLDTETIQRALTSKHAIGLGIDCADSLLWEGVTGHARRLIPLFTDDASNPRGNALVLLTKSANTHYLAQIPDVALHRRGGRVPNVAVSMSVNPEPIADLWEGKFPDTLERVTPGIGTRLLALRAAQDMGFEVRLRVDPILPVPGWEDLYSSFFVDVAYAAELRPTMITLGTYREKQRGQIAIWNAKWGLPPTEYTPRVGTREGTHVHEADRAAVYATTRVLVERAFDGTGFQPAVSLCKETHAVRKETALCNADCNCLRADLRVPPQHVLPVVG